MMIRYLQAKPLLSKSVRTREQGQAVVEMAIMFPVVLIVAIIAVNALLFISECAEFDRIMRQSVRTYATAPSYGETNSQVNAKIQAALEAEFNEPNISVHVASEGVAFGQTAYKAVLEYTPTLFGVSLQNEVFGVSLLQMRHSAELTIDTYRPGVLL